jgi:hypothetical protein
LCSRLFLDSVKGLFKYSLRSAVLHSQHFTQNLKYFKIWFKISFNFMIVVYVHVLFKLYIVSFSRLFCYPICQLLGILPWQKADLTDPHFNEFVLWTRKRTSKVWNINKHNIIKKKIRNSFQLFFSSIYNFFPFVAAKKFQEYDSPVPKTLQENNTAIHFQWSF